MTQWMLLSKINFYEKRKVLELYIKRCKINFEILWVNYKLKAAKERIRKCHLEVR